MSLISFPNLIITYISPLLIAASVFGGDSQTRREVLLLRQLRPLTRANDYANRKLKNLALQLSRSKDIVTANEGTYVLARFYLGQNNTKRAKGLLTSLVAQDKNQTEPSARFLRPSYYYLGNLVLKEGKQDEAFRLYKQYIRMMSGRGCTPEFVNALERIGDLYITKNLPGNALLSYENAVGIVKGINYEEERKAYNLTDIRAKIRKLKRTRDIERLGEDEVLFREAEWLRKHQKFNRALEKYTRIEKEFPKSKRYNASRYWVGDCLRWEGKPDRAIAQWNAIIAQSKSGAPWRGHTLLGLGDISLEQKYDLRAAKKYYDIAMKELGSTSDASWRLIRADLYERRGLCEYIQGKFDEATELFTRGAYFRPEPKKKAGGWSTGFENLAKACMNRKLTTPSKVLRRGSDKAKLLIALADAYSLSYNHQRAQILFSQALQLKRSEITQNQKAYCNYREGIQWYQLYGMNRSDGLRRAMNLFKKGYVEYRRSEWAPESMLMYAVLNYNNLRNEIVMKDPKKAKEYELATLKLYAQLQKTFPRSRQAQIAGYYRCFIYYWSEDWKATSLECKRFLSRYGKSEYADHVKQVYAYVSPRVPTRN